MIEGVGPRYCPSIEDKVVRFKDRDRHPLFLEPEGRFTHETYVQGMSSSLPEDVQLAVLRSIEGMEEVEILRPAYAVEYDCIPATQLYPWLETKLIKGLFCAGQINGTSGYEEAAAQGLIAGINSVHYVFNKKPFILPRSSSYIGTLIDDLVTKEIRDPYRMLTSRTEYRLILRHDNADMRLTPLGYEIGLIPSHRYERFLQKKSLIETELNRLATTKIKPSDEINQQLKELCDEQIQMSVSLKDLLKRPKVNYNVIVQISSEQGIETPCSNTEIIEQVELSLKYEGYINRQLDQIERMKNHENKPIPEGIDYYQIKSLAREAQDKLSKIRPLTIGQASRVGGVTPSDISILLTYLSLVKIKKQND